MFNKKIAMIVGACGAVLGFIFTLIGIISNGNEEKTAEKVLSAGMSGSTSVSGPGNVFVILGMIFFIAAIGFLAFYLFKKGIKKNVALGAGAGGAVLGLVFAIISIVSNTYDLTQMTAEVGKGNIFAIISMIIFLAASCYLTLLIKKNDQ